MPEEYETLLVCGEKESTEESSAFIVKGMGLDYIHVPEMKRSLNPLRDWKAYRKIKKIIREFKPDIVHTHAAKAGTIGRLAAFSEKVPVVVHTFHGHVFHSYFGKLSSKFFLAIERYLAKKSSGIIAISEKQKFELAIHYKLCKQEKLRVIPLGFDLSKFQENTESKRVAFRKKYLLEDEEIAVGIIGRLVPIKNHSLFLKAAKLVHSKSRKKVRFFLIGDGPERQYISDLAEKLGMDYCYFPDKPAKATITLCSWIHDIDLVVSGLDIVALSSLNEGTPVSLIEAQAGNKPIVSTRVGGIENIVLEGETALLTSDFEPETFSERLLELTENDDKRSHMMQSGWKLVCDRFHYTRLVSDTKQYYEMLLRKAKKRR